MDYFLVQTGKQQWQYYNSLVQTGSSNGKTNTKIINYIGHSLVQTGSNNEKTNSYEENVMVSVPPFETLISLQDLLLKLHFTNDSS